MRISVCARRCIAGIEYIMHPTTMNSIAEKSVSIDEKPIQPMSEFGIAALPYDALHLCIVDEDFGTR
jgi:hypothetical protein